MRGHRVVLVCVRGHSLSGSNLKPSKTGTKVCRTCATERNAAYRGRQRAKALTLDPTGARRSKRPLDQRFWRSERIADDAPYPGLGKCWEWTGARFVSGGYGAINLNGRPVRAHRVSWFLATGRWPSPLALHRCDNPPCVRPLHLFEGTHQDNVRDMWAKGRASPPPH